METNSRTNSASKKVASISNVNAPIGKQYFSDQFKEKIEKAITCYGVAKSIFKYSRAVFFSTKYSFSAN